MSPDVIVIGAGASGLKAAAPLESRAGLLYKRRFAPFPTPLEAGANNLKDKNMAAIKQLAAVTRSGTGKGAARSVRREGRVPGVIYGGGEKAEPISVNFKDINKLVYAGHFLTSIFELEVEGRKERVLPRDYQLDVVTDLPLHVDFLRLAPGSRPPAPAIRRCAAPD